LSRGKGAPPESVPLAARSPRDAAVPGGGEVVLKINSFNPLFIPILHEMYGFVNSRRTGDTSKYQNKRVMKR
jgi:hypothetical protein